MSMQSSIVTLSFFHKKDEMRLGRPLAAHRTVGFAESAGTTFTSPHGIARISGLHIAMSRLEEKIVSAPCFVPGLAYE
jgi:hypothetical protein